MPPPVIIRNGGGSGGGGGGGMIAVVVMMFCILLSGIVGAGLYIFWEDLFPPGPGAPGAPGSTTPSPDPYYSSPSPTDSSSPADGGSSSPAVAPGPKYTSPEGPLEMLTESMKDFRLKRLSDEKTLEETGWKLIMYKDGRDYRWNYDHKGNDGGFIYNNDAGGNHAMFNSKPAQPKDSIIHLSQRHGSEDKPYWYFKLWRKQGWGTRKGSNDRDLKYYRITPSDDDGTGHCLTFESDDGPAVWRDCERDENSEAFKKQVYTLAVGG